MIWATVATVFGIRRPTALVGPMVGRLLPAHPKAAEEVRSRRAEVEQALADLEHANRQLALANERMAVLRAIAEEAQKSKTEFVARVSHEFRTPLNMIIGLVDLLVETPEVYGEALPTAFFEDLKIVHRNCEHLSSMVSDVLDLSQVEAGRVALHQERVNLAELIDGAVAVVASLLERKGLALAVEVPPDLPVIYCDPTRIRQVVLNLVSNAVRFTERGGITIRAAQEGDAVQVSVADTGPGITPEDALRIFEPFCQGNARPLARSGRQRAGPDDQQAVHRVARGAHLAGKPARPGRHLRIFAPDLAAAGAHRPSQPLDQRRLEVGGAHVPLEGAGIPVPAARGDLR